MIENLISSYKFNNVDNPELIEAINEFTKDSHSFSAPIY